MGIFTTSRGGLGARCPSLWERKVPPSLPNPALKIGPQKGLALGVVLRLHYLPSKSTGRHFVLQMKTVGQCFIALHFFPPAPALSPFKWKWKNGNEVSVMHSISIFRKDKQGPLMGTPKRWLLRDGRLKINLNVDRLVSNTIRQPTVNLIHFMMMWNITERK